MKKLLIIILALFLGMFFFYCNDTTSINNGNENASGNSSLKFNIIVPTVLSAYDVKVSINVNYNYPNPDPRDVVKYECNNRTESSQFIETIVPQLSVGTVRITCKIYYFQGSTNSTCDSNMTGWTLYCVATKSNVSVVANQLTRVPMDFICSENPAEFGDIEVMVDDVYMVKWIPGSTYVLPSTSTVLSSGQIVTGVLIEAYQGSSTTSTRIEIDAPNPPIYSSTPDGTFDIRVLVPQSLFTATSSPTIWLHAKKASPCLEKWEPVVLYQYHNEVTIILNQCSTASCTMSAIGWIGGGSNGWKTTNGATSNSDLKSFDAPCSVSLDSIGNIYIADYYNNRISKWDDNGNAIGWIGGGSNGWKTTNDAAGGSDYRSFNKPTHAFVDTSDNIYVADQFNSRISKWDSSGNAVGWIGGGSNGWKTISTTSSGYNELSSFNLPVGLWVDNGYIYVADKHNNRISKWTVSGNAIGWIGGGSNGWKTSGYTSSGNSYTSFTTPTHVFVNGSDIYVADHGAPNNRISKWNINGNAIGWIGYGSNGWSTQNGSSVSDSYSGFSRLHDVFVVSDIIAVADQENHRISFWNTNGTPIGWIGGGSDCLKTSNGTNYSQDYRAFNQMDGIWIKNNIMYIADKTNNRISKWSFGF